MRSEDSLHDASSLGDYLRVLRRHKWIVLGAVVLVPLAVVLLSLQQDKRFQASSEVLLNPSLSGTPDLFGTQDPARLAETQARLARVPLLAERVLKAAGVTNKTPQEFLNSSAVSAEPNTDLIQFQVDDSDPSLAVRLATEYGRQFTIYRRQLDTASVKRARRDIQGRINELKAAGEQRSPLYTTLVESEQQLGTTEALQTSNASLVRPATNAQQIQPRPVRNGVLGLVLGIVLGLGLAFLWEALNTRVRSADEIAGRLRLPLLARLPEPPRKLQAGNQLAMLVDPHSSQAEAFRMLRVNLEFVNLERGARTIMVTSAVEEEGKSTTIANLAVALAKAGRRVALVDLDLRRPFLARFFDLNSRSGVSEVALGHVELEDALVSIPLNGTNGQGETRRLVEPNGRWAADGGLEVLTAGATPPDVGEFAGTRALDEILERLRERADIVLIDAPPLLRLGDAMALSANVDALVVIVRLNVVRRPMLHELHRMLETSPAQKLGFVLTGAEREEGYGYGAYYYREYGAQPPAREAVSTDGATPEEVVPVREPEA